MASFKTIFAFDAEGFYVCDTLLQEGEGIYLPDDCTDQPLPAADPAKNFFRWDGEAWQVVPKPTCAADMLGVTISHKTRTPHDIEMRALMQAFCKGSKEYRVERGEDLSWTVVKVTAAEEEVEAAQKELADFDAQLTDLKDRMSLAMLMGDDEQIASLRTAYQDLMK